MQSLQAQMKRGDQVPIKILGKRTAEAYAEAQFEALKRLSKEGIETPRMKLTEKEVMDDDVDGEWADF